jgi:hypothetical protein
MTTAAASTALVTIQPAFTAAERLPLAGFLAGYRGLTREAYALDLRQFATWCRARCLALFPMRRSGWTGTAPGGSSARPPAGPGSARRSRLTRSGMRSSRPRLMPGSHRATCGKPRRTPIRAPRCGMTGRAAGWTGMPPTSSPLT